MKKTALQFSPHPSVAGMKGPRCQCCGKTIWWLTGRTGHSYKLRQDHNHRSGKLRGKVCGGCNLKISYVEFPLDNKADFQMVMQYLERFDPNWHATKHTVEAFTA